jgi:hypothetical protein
MDLEPAMKIAVRRISEALHDYASEHKWKKDDNDLEVVVNADWGRIYVTFVGKAFKSRDGYERFNEVQNWLEKKLKKYPELIEAIDLIVRDPDQYEVEGPFPLGLSDERVPEDLLKSVKLRRLNAS